MLTVLLAAAVMIANDGLVEFRNIAQVRGNAKLAAVLGPLASLAGIAVTCVGAGEVIKHGLTPHTLAVLAALLAADTFDGYVFTMLGRRIKAES